MANQDRHTPGRKGPDKPSDKTQPPGLKGALDQRGVERWDVIDEASWESFPGSDSPSHWAGRDISPEERKGEKSDTSDTSDTSEQDEEKKDN